MADEATGYVGPLADGRWLYAANLHAGDHLLNADGTWAEVVGAETVNEPLLAYNLTVEGFHTYFVAGDVDAAPVWVHNSCGGIGGGASLSNLTPSEITRIQNAANRIGVPITVVGSRAGGTAHALSDWDFVFPDGTTNRQIRKIVNSLPEGFRDTYLGRTTDFFTGPIDETRPFITFLPD